MKVKEDVLLKALANIEEELAKSNDQVDGTVEIPKTTKAANGALSKVGDAEELAAKSAAALTEYVGKALAASGDDEEEEEDESSDEDTSKSLDDDEDELDAPRTRKSIAQVMKGNMGDEVIDGMPFLENLVEEVSSAERDLRKSVQGFRTEQTGFNDSMAKAVSGIAQLVLNVNEKLNTLMKQPVSQRRSVVHKSEVSQRFGQQQGGMALGSEDFPYSKQQVLKALCELTALNKVNSLAVPIYEGEDRMPPDVQQAVITHLQRN